MTHILTRLILALVCIASASDASAADVYVQPPPAGDNARSCATAENIATPKATLSSAVACLGPGETLWVRAGTYAETLEGTIPAGTSWASPVRIANYNGETATVRPNAGNHLLDFRGTQQYIEWDGITLDGSNTVQGVVRILENPTLGRAHHIRIKNAELIANPTPGQPNLTECVLATAEVTGAIGSNEFQNLICHGGNSHGLYIQSPNNLVEFCVIYDILKKGIQFNNSNSPQTPPNTNTVRYNVIRDFTRIPESWNTNSPAATGIIVFVGTGNKVYGNLIYDIDRTVGAGGSGTNTPIGLDIWSNSTEVYNNTIAGIPGPGLRTAQGGTTGTIIRNTISWSNAPNYENNGTGTVASNNLGSTAPGWTNSDPLFISQAADNYRLNSASPGINAGTSTAPINTLVTTDIDGTSRPQDGTMDIGAFEFRTTPSTGPTVQIQTPTTGDTYSTTATALEAPEEPFTVLATDDGSVVSCAWVNSAISGSGGALFLTGGIWTATIIPLTTLAVNTITVTCVDNDATEGSDSLAVTTTGVPTPSFRLQFRVGP